MKSKRNDSDQQLQKTDKTYLCFRVRDKSIVFSTVPVSPSGSSGGAAPYELVINYSVLLSGKNQHKKTGR